MLKKSFVLFLLGCSVGVCSAELKPYVAAEVGCTRLRIQSVTSEFGAGVAGMAGLAYKPNDIFDSCAGARIELAVSTQYNAVDVDSITTDVYISDLFINGYLDLYGSEKFSLYALGGIGQAFLSLDDGTFSDDTDSTAYQAGAGLAYELSSYFNIDLKYRYMLTRPWDGYIRSSTLALGVRVMF